MGYLKCCFIIAFAFILLSENVYSLKLPHYITACNRNAKDLNECAKRNGQAAIPSIVEGDPKYRVPNMLPFKLPQVALNANKNLKISLKDIEIYGLENIIIRNVNYDVKNQHMQFKVYLPQATLLGEYDIKGRILILPINGNGLANITLVSGTFVYDVDYNLVDRKGVEYMEIKKSGIQYDVKRMFINLSNLFDGNKSLGDEMNKFLNENWEDVSKDLGPALTETISQIITSILSNIMKKVPYAEVFPE